jgi:hypothetical protein
MGIHSDPSVRNFDQNTSIRTFSSDDVDTPLRRSEFDGVGQQLLKGVRYAALISTQEGKRSAYLN